MADNPQGDQGAVVREVEAAQMPHELDPLYWWVTRDVLGSSSVLSQDYLDELRLLGVIFGGRDLERRYRVEVARPREWVCYLNLDYPTVPNWLWVNEAMFTEFGIRVLSLISNSVCPGNAKKGYMSVRPSKNRKIFGLHEYSFHDFKCRFFKILPVGDHRPFLLSLEGGTSTADIFALLFLERNLKPKSVIGKPSEAWESIVKMAGNDVTLARLRNLLRPPPIRAGESSSDVGKASDQLVDVSSPNREDDQLPPPRKRPAGDSFIDVNKLRIFEGDSRKVSTMDRSFNALGFIEASLLGPRAQEALRD
ncbi:hypothetical protein PIB30_058285 [Stylosanthes scabra]|uniref:Uncharacterized protein n=1 Tax=Stylosanthes scabra TaxID=79078 RepID=A0ABU6XJR9_9FABA|nr:hypothetical protein [Stylosanthes scabra]